MESTWQEPILARTLEATSAACQGKAHSPRRRAFHDQAVRRKLHREVFSALAAAKGMVAAHRGHTAVTEAIRLAPRG
jgi:hypothetical protein